jgi:hypothetical protein
VRCSCLSSELGLSTDTQTNLMHRIRLIGRDLSSRTGNTVYHTCVPFFFLSSREKCLVEEDGSYVGYVWSYLSKSQAWQQSIDETIHMQSEVRPVTIDFVHKPKISSSRARYQIFSSSTRTSFSLRSCSSNSLTSPCGSFIILIAFITTLPLYQSLG